MDDARPILGDGHSTGTPVTGKVVTPFVQAATALKTLLDGLDGKKSDPSATGSGRIKPVAIDVPAEADEDEGDDEDDLD
jgi:hypothetical protein